MSDMDILYQKYLNIRKFITQYRKYEVTDNKPILDQSEFQKQMITENYVKCDCFDAQNNKKIFVILFKKDSKYIKSTANFKKLMMGLGKDKFDAIIISKDALSIYIKKLIPKLENITIYNYSHKHFSIEIPKGPLCSKHTILTQAEVQQLCSNELMIHPLGLPSILETDPQCIWIGARMGDIIKIEALSEIAGQAIRYRLVIPAIEAYEQPETTDSVEHIPVESIGPDEL